MTHPPGGFVPDVYQGLNLRDYRIFILQIALLRNGTNLNGKKLQLTPNRHTIANELLSRGWRKEQT